MKKHTFIKVFVLLLIFSFVLPTMTGCGGHLGGDGKFLIVTSHYDEDNDKGTYVTVGGGLSSNIANDWNSDGKGLAKRPLFTFASGETSNGGIFSNASLRVPTIHYFAHYCVTLVGATMDCGPYQGKCDTTDALDLNPIKIATSALGIGQQLAGELSGFSEGIAMGLMFAIWFGNWLTMIIQERFTPEAFIKGCLMLIVGALVIDKATELAGAFISSFGGDTTVKLDVGDFSESINMTYSYAALGLNVPIAQIGVPLGYVFFDKIGPPIIAIISSVIILFAQVQCAVALASALIPAGIEISLRIQAAPIMFALSTQTGWGPPMISYLKGCIAAAVTPAVICNVVSAASKASFFDGGGGMIMTAIKLAISYKIVAGFVGQVGTIVHQVISH